MEKFSIEKVKFNSDGLIAAIAQDYKSKDILMIAWMNKEALNKTIKTKKVHYWSRSRNKLWLKGEESGNIQKVKEIYIDCDMDAVLIKVEQIGKAACHTGYRSCFYRKINSKNMNLKICDKKIFDPEKVYKK
jgi:phosphoribosyl-AMP cyclohydrolase